MKEVIIGTLTITISLLLCIIFGNIFYGRWIGVLSISLLVFILNLSVLYICIGVEKLIDKHHEKTTNSGPDNN